jgi:hypothetical protein
LEAGARRARAKPGRAARFAIYNPSSSANEASCSLQAHRRGDNAVSGNSLSESLPLARRDISGVALVSSASAAWTPAACSTECLMGVMPRGARGRLRPAVRTCVLASRWCNLWKVVPALRITPATAGYFSVPSALNDFGNRLLRLRDRVPLLAAELNSFNPFQGRDYFDEAVQYLELWVRLLGTVCRVPSPNSVSAPMVSTIWICRAACR